MSNSSGVQADAATVGDTWGVPGPTFLAWYGACAAVALLLTLFLRFRGGRHGRPASPGLSPEHAAFLAGGGPRAFYAAVSALRMNGRLDVGGHHALAALGPIRVPGETQLQSAIVAAAAGGRPTSEVRTDPAVSSALQALAADAQQWGLSRTPAQIRVLRFSVWPLVVVLVLGVARLMAAGSHPSGYLKALMFLVFVLLLALLLSVPLVTPVGRSALSRTRAANRHLAVRRSPSWSAYGPGGAAMSVALFGPAALFSMDPAFADEIGVPRVLANSGGGSTAWTGGSDGGSSEGGSSGSSCGGGGGCGGGGCGG